MKYQINEETRNKKKKEMKIDNQKNKKIRRNEISILFF